MGALSVAVAGFFAAVCGVMFQRVSDNLCGDGPAAALPVAFHRPIENRSVNAAVQRRHPLATPWEPGLVAIACNPVHLSAYYGWEHLIRMQLLLMSNPDATNEVHMTAMHVAVARGNYRAVRSLLEAGARTSMHDAHNKTALVLARRGAPKDSGAKAIAFHRTTAFLIACGVCSTEICTPAEAGGMRELEVLDARARMGSATKDERLPAGCGHKIPRVSARAALYREIHSQALADNHPAVSATAGLAASVELRRLAGAGDIDTPRATEAARQWINESISRNPNTHLWIERQRELQRAASARETLVLAKHSVTVEAISHSNPPIIIVRGLLTRLECEAVVQLAHRWETSAVSSGKIDAAIRVSETSWWHDNSHLRRSIDQRVSALVGLPVCNAESPQLVRYGRSGGHFNSHLDAPTSRVSLIGDLQRGWSQLDGERVSTVLTCVPVWFAAQ